MMASSIIVFREVLEMTLVVSILLSVTRGLYRSRALISIGVISGLIAASIVALFMQEMEESMDGNGEFVFNAVVLLIATCLIAWTVIWMSKQGRQMASDLKQAGARVVAGDAPKLALITLSFAAVMREGSEAVFFLFGAAQMIQSEADMFYGSVLGFVAGGLLGWLLYRGLSLLPLRPMLQLTSWFLIILAAGMASQAASNLVIIDMLPPLVDSLWNTSQWLSEDSFLGEFLQVAIGYDTQPSGIQLLAFIVVLAGIGAFKHHAEHMTSKAVPSH